MTNQPTNHIPGSLHQYPDRAGYTGASCWIDQLTQLINQSASQSINQTITHDQPTDQ